MSNIVGNYFRLGPLTEIRALPRVSARASAHPDPSPGPGGGRCGAPGGRLGPTRGVAHSCAGITPLGASPAGALPLALPPVTVLAAAPAAGGVVSAPAELPAPAGTVVRSLLPVLVLILVRVLLLGREGARTRVRASAREHAGRRAAARGHRPEAMKRRGDHRLDLPSRAGRGILVREADRCRAHRAAPAFAASWSTPAPHLLFPVRQADLGGRRHGVPDTVVTP